MPDRVTNGGVRNLGDKDVRHNPCAGELLADIEKDGAPILITQHGLPAAYLVDVEAYDALQQRIGLLEGIARGEKAIEDGRVVTHAKAKQRMSRWLK